MICSECGGKVQCRDNANTDKNEVYRKRKCLGCGRIFYTIEFEVDKDEAFMKEWRRFARDYAYRMDWKGARK